MVIIKIWKKIIDSISHIDRNKINTFVKMLFGTSFKSKVNKHVHWSIKYLDMAHNCALVDRSTSCEAENLRYWQMGGMGRHFLLSINIILMMWTKFEMEPSRDTPITIDTINKICFLPAFMISWRANVLKKTHISEKACNCRDVCSLSLSLFSVVIKKW